MDISYKGPKIVVTSGFCKISQVDVLQNKEGLAFVNAWGMCTVLFSKDGGDLVFFWLFGLFVKLA